ncbi:peptidoglycan-binding protein [Bradyrhizobium sp. MOS002]|uniref:peptidoglycan-binding domain-containing protein n=1 Tax=Bradyrhizobium sp. MOS002 TaxID=2133947 RepID=UPI000D1184FA|nr:peptidoglycan-binding domain-containing protein [Bradyrhizobium sp. MOS002]PSO30607.1 hypothetical protein C7G41_17410 [Bradyrhizobium sp. MOS002]
MYIFFVGFFSRLSIPAALLALAYFLCLPSNHADGQTLPASQVRVLQEALIWTTDYEGLVDGRLGPGTKQAISSFQKRGGNDVTGVLTPVQIEQLIKEGSTKKEKFGFKQVEDANVGIAVGIPLGLLGKPTFTKWGKHWNSPENGLSVDLIRFGADVTLKDFHDRLVGINNRRVAYDRFVDNDWFVISAFEKDAAVYVRANVVQLSSGASEIRGFSIWMSKDRPSGYQAIAPAMLSSFRSNDDKTNDATLSATPRGGPLVPPPALPVNPPSTRTLDAPARALDTTGTAAPGRLCLNGLGDCPQVLNAFR